MTSRVARVGTTMPSHLPVDVRMRLAQALRGTLRVTRLSAALTQRQMARRVGIGLSTYVRMEQGRMAPGGSTLRKLCRVLCLSLDALVGEECASAVRRASRRSRKRRARVPGGATSPAAVLPGPSMAPWGLLWGASRRPVLESLPLLLVRRGTPLALVVDVG